MLTLMLLCSGISCQAFAHASEQGFVLLLPTQVYIITGVLAVAITTIALCFVPSSLSLGLFVSVKLIPIKHRARAKIVFSALSFALLLFWLIAGFYGPHDPLKNVLPLSIWTLFWIGFVVLSGVFGNLWQWLNPWSAIYQCLVPKPLRNKPLLRYPAQLSYLPAIVTLLACTAFVLADVAPEDPIRLFYLVCSYCVLSFFAMIVFGESQWLAHGEFLSVMLHTYGKLSPFQRIANTTSGQQTLNTQPVTQSNLSIGGLYMGVPAWRLNNKLNQSIGLAVFIICLLACGSFDGLNETFWWLATIGVNPLAYPGRSSVIPHTIGALVLANIALLVIVALCIKLGLLVVKHLCKHDARIHDSPVSFKTAFTGLSVALLPIAFAYHFAHYLTSFMVNYQYALLAYSDPFANGADYLHLGQYYVSTGFFNSQSSVKAIWLTQAMAVVVGHLLSVLLAHNISLKLHRNTKHAVLSQIPFALLMVLYTFLGLWLLAAPKGA